MKLRAGILTSVILIALAVWLRNDRAILGFHNPLAVSGRSGGDLFIVDEPQGEAPPRRLRSAERGEPQPDATHGAHQLRDFHLAPLEISGMSLAAALEKLRAAYEDACRISGETPLRISFLLPPGSPRPLTLSLQSKSMDAGIRLLGAMAGLKVRREGSSYHFQKPEELGRSVSIPLPESFAQGLGEFSGVGSEAGDLLGILAAMGFEISPAAALRNDGRTAITTASAADHAAITALIDLVARNPPIQYSSQTKIIKLAADSTWKMPDASNLTTPEVQFLMREFSQMRGTVLMTAPSVVSRAGQETKVEILRDVIVPNESGGFDTRAAGLTIAAAPSSLAFGAASKLDVKDTAYELDPATGKFDFRDRINITDSFYAKNSDTRLMLETHADGSRTLVLVSHLPVDANGQPR
jgi:hypothetical protein